MQPTKRIRHKRRASLGNGPERHKVQVYLTVEEKELIHRAAVLTDKAESGWASTILVREAERAIAEHEKASTTTKSRR